MTNPPAFVPVQTVPTWGTFGGPGPLVRPTSALPQSLGIDTGDLVVAGAGLGMLGLGIAGRAAAGYYLGKKLGPKDSYAPAMAAVVAAFPLPSVLTLVGLAGLAYFYDR
jgi:hypothetical protein